MTTRVWPAAGAALLWATTTVGAQELAAPAQRLSLAEHTSEQVAASAVEIERQPVGQFVPTADPPAWFAERRACEGCPTRSVGKALLQTTIVNVLYGGANLARGQVTRGSRRKPGGPTCSRAACGTSTISS